MAIGEADVNLSKNSNRPVVICGPSGVGKGTIINAFMENKTNLSRFGFSVSHTTRQPRVGEVNGIHYHFTTVDQMKKDIDNGLFLEHANVHGNLYGTSKKAVQDVAEKGKICILDIDVQGVQNTKKYDDFEATYIFIAPPSFETLKERLIGRGTESAETLRKRTENARIELEYGMKEGNFHHIIVNDIVENARSELQSILGEIYSL
eukprot:CAMPEP_0116054538 /NCGR_PEP_ID=MMETSP0322-20121206/2863_1 /TAXON_ID=163516 /ORGANISM="Leptocylindrus danicus var. apora, Strain B651" /LENGTH=205 /DNA_ID=CAMNT_0003537953 /DNA_START=243 /DNA_END=860 /DNA_ORIENTATION=-